MAPKIGDKITAALHPRTTDQKAKKREGKKPEQSSSDSASAQTPGSVYAQGDQNFVNTRDEVTQQGLEILKSKLNPHERLVLEALQAGGGLQKARPSDSNAALAFPKKSTAYLQAAWRLFAQSAAGGGTFIAAKNGIISSEATTERIILAGTGVGLASIPAFFDLVPLMGAPVTVWQESAVDQADLRGADHNSQELARHVVDQKHRFIEYSLGAAANATYGLALAEDWPTVGYVLGATV